MYWDDTKSETLARPLKEKKGFWDISAAVQSPKEVCSSEYAGTGLGSVRLSLQPSNLACEGVSAMMMSSLVSGRRVLVSGVVVREMATCGHGVEKRQEHA